MDTQITTDSKYPTLKIIAVAFKVLAIVGIIPVAIPFFSSIGTLAFTAVFWASLIGIIPIISLLFLSEIISVLTDIEYNTRRIWIHNAAQDNKAV